ncbi:MAG: hypothetical protein ACLQIB_34305 [Isosphaeraceae bacterium]
MIKRAIALGFLASGAAGCSHGADWMIRKPAVESTIGNDPNQAPAGKVIPPRGMGVDLGARLSIAGHMLRA